MKNSRPALLIGTLLLAGCAGSGGHDTPSQSTWWNPVSWSWSSVAPWHWFGSTAQISEHGVGAITGTTPLEEKALEDGLSGNYTLRKGMRMVNGSVVPFWQALDDGKQIKLELSGQTTVSRIDVMDNKLSTTTGVTVGTRFSDIYKQAFDVCKKGSGAERDGVICQAPGSQHISYVFTGDWHGPESLLPADDTLKSWTLSKIIWQR